MLMDPHHSQQHADLQRAVFRLQRAVTRLNFFFNFSSCCTIYYVSVTIEWVGSGFGSVGRAVASNTRGLQFKSSHQQKFIYIDLRFRCVWTFNDWPIS